MDKRLRVQLSPWCNMQLLTKEAMESLSTPRLLAYRKQLRKRNMQESQDWNETMNDAKAILDTREHVKRKK